MDLITTSPTTFTLSTTFTQCTPIPIITTSGTTTTSSILHISTSIQLTATTFTLPLVTVVLITCPTDLSPFTTGENSLGILQCIDSISFVVTGYNSIIPITLTLENSWNFPILATKNSLLDICAVQPSFDAHMLFTSLTSILLPISLLDLMAIYTQFTMEEHYCLKHPFP